MAVESVRVAGPDRAPGAPGDAQDERRDRETDDRVGARETYRYRSRRDDDAQGDEPVDTRVVPVGDKRGAVEPLTGAQADSSRKLIPEKANERRDHQHRKMREIARVDQAIDRFHRGYRRRREDRQHDRISRVRFAAVGSEPERNAQGNCCQRVAAVVDEIGEQRDGTRHQNCHGLKASGRGQNRQTPRDRAYPRPRPHDRRIDSAMHVIFVMVTVDGCGTRPERQTRVTMGTVVMVLVRPQPVPVFERPVHVTTLRSPEGAA